MTANITNTLSSPLKNTLSHDVKSKTAPLVDIHNTDPKMLKLDKKAVNKEADVVFSDRSLKMQAISKDFFSTGGLALSDVPKYIQRLQKDGFISAQQSQKLCDSNIGKAEKLSRSTVKIVNFLSDFKVKLVAQDKQDPLIDILSQASKIVENLGEMNAKTSAETVKGTLFKLQAYLDSTDASKWSKASLRSLNDVKSILSVTDKLALNPSNSKATNRYLQVSKGTI